MDAFRDFETAMRDIGLIRRRADAFTTVLEKKYLRSEARLEEALTRQNEGETGPGSPDAAELQVERRRKILEYRYNTMAAWKRHSPRRTVIAYCTAFETFLRDFLVEQLVQRPERLALYIQQQVQHPVKIDPPLKTEAVDDCIAAHCLTFQSLGEGSKVAEAYRHVFGINPFDKFHVNKIFRDGHRLKAVRMDIHILFTLRHQFVHRNGSGGEKYRLDLLGTKRMRYRARFDQAWAVNYPKDAAPNADEILSSPAIDITFRSKLDELADSLQHYVEYIVEVCLDALGRADKAEQNLAGVPT